jgi:hypothetical protein
MIFTNPKKFLGFLLEKTYHETKAFFFPTDFLLSAIFLSQFAPKKRSLNSRFAFSQQRVGI